MAPTYIFINYNAGKLIYKCHLQGFGSDGDETSLALLSFVDDFADLQQLGLLSVIPRFLPAS